MRLPHAAPRSPQWQCRSPHATRTTGPTAPGWRRRGAAARTARTPGWGRDRPSGRDPADDRLCKQERVERPVRTGGGKPLQRGNRIGQRQWRMRDAIDDPHEHERNERRSDRAMQVVQPILPRPAPLVRARPTEREHEQDRHGDDPVQHARGHGVGGRRAHRRGSDLRARSLDNSAHGCVKAGLACADETAPTADLFPRVALNLHGRAWPGHPRLRRRTRRGCAGSADKSTQSAQA